MSEIFNIELTKEYKKELEKLKKLQHQIEDEIHNIFVSHNESKIYESTSFKMDKIEIYFNIKDYNMIDVYIITDLQRYFNLHGFLEPIDENRMKLIFMLN